MDLILTESIYASVSIYCNTTFSKLDISKYPGLDAIGPMILNISNDIIYPSITCLTNKRYHMVYFQTLG